MDVIVHPYIIWESANRGIRKKAVNMTPTMLPAVLIPYTKPDERPASEDLREQKGMQIGVIPESIITGVK
jgi:hypothetical protein